MEAELIRWLRSRLAPHPAVPLGPGDDTALVRVPQQGLPPTAPAECLVTVDMLMDGVDFRLAEIDPRRAGHKALAVNLSDLAAMAGAPLAAVVALALPRDGGEALAKQLYEGLLPLAEQFDMAIAGGDVNSWDGPLVISITLLGTPRGRGAVTRSGALPGDKIVVTGQFGGSLLGRHLDFMPRVAEAQLIHSHFDLHAATDVSDGLSLDLSHIAAESRCGVLLEVANVPLAPAAVEMSARDGRSPLEHALADGEDFELIMALPAEDAARLVASPPVDVPVTIVGEFLAEPGLWQQDAAGNRRPLPATGYEHELR